MSPIFRTVLLVLVSTSGLLPSQRIAVCARSIQLPVRSEQPSTAGCIDALVRRIQTVSMTSSSSPETALDTDNSSMRQLLKDYIECVDGASKWHRNTSTMDESRALAEHDYDVIDMKPFETNALRQSSELTPETVAMSGVRRLPVSSADLRSFFGDVPDVIEVMEDIGDERRPAMSSEERGGDEAEGHLSVAGACSTVECAARSVTSTCRQVFKAAQCLALIGAFESALQLRLLHPAEVHVTPTRPKKGEELVEENMAQRGNDKTLGSDENDDNSDDDDDDDDVEREEGDEIDLLRRALLTRLVDQLRDYQLSQHSTASRSDVINVVGPAAEGGDDGRMRRRERGRVRRAVNVINDRMQRSSKLPNMSLKIPMEKLTPDMVAYIHYVQAYRKMNGSGKLNARFG